MPEQRRTDMLIKQISVFVENKKGRLYHLTKTLADHGIDLKALSISDTEMCIRDRIYPVSFPAR